MSAPVDTSAEAVGMLARDLERAVGQTRDVRQAAAATLRALLAERDAARAEVARLRAERGGVRVWRHKKRGSVYAEVGRALLQAATGPVGEAAVLVIYRGEGGRMWAREEGEFEDGRFEQVPSGPAEDDPHA